ncbi:MAG: S8 family peptidase [Pseudomonadota bacterium]|nr:S8 family peptidase [Pseudomonadota bacterium]
MRWLKDIGTGLLRVILVSSVVTAAQYPVWASDWQGLGQDPFGLVSGDMDVDTVKTMPLSVPGEFVVDASSASALAQTEQHIAGQVGQGAYSLAAIPNSTLGVVKFPVPKGGWVNFNDYLDLLEKAPGVKAAQPNYARYTTSAGALPDDPMVDKQWYLGAINMDKAWQVNQDASAVTVAVIDDAIMLSHEDLQGNLWVNTREQPGNGLDDDGNGYIDDIHGWNFGAGTNDPSPTTAECIKSGHGTHVAGAIGAVGGNNVGVTGIAPRVRIMALAIGRPDSRCGLDSAGILEAVRYAVDNGARVINLSLGGPMGTRIARETYRYASEHNVLLVVAAGNDGLSNDLEDVPRGSQMILTALVRDKKIVHRALAPSYPAAFSRDIPGMLTVANLNQEGRGRSAMSLYRHRLSWDVIGEGVSIQGGQLAISGLRKLKPGTMVVGSSYGQRTVQVGSPGTDIFSTVPRAAGSGAQSGYKMMTGTSMASPITAGAAALVWSSFPDLSNIEVKQRLLASARNNPDLQGKVSSSGQLDVYAALCGDQFSRKAAGCTKGGGARGSRPEAPPSAAAPPSTRPQPKPEPKPEPEPAPKPTMNDWLRGADEEGSSTDGIEW